jgi:hypothetical protein
VIHFKKQRGMQKLRVVFGFVALVSALALSAANASAAQIGHDHFVSDPYPDNWCGIDGTSVDNVVANYTLDGSRTSLRVMTTFTATASGKSMEILQSGLRTSGSPVDNGDGTYTVTFTNSGPSPLILLPTGQALPETGLLVGVATFDSATDDFLDFEIVKLAGLRTSGSCTQIIAAMS